MAVSEPVGGGCTPWKWTQTHLGGCKGPSASVSWGGRWLEVMGVGSAYSGVGPGLALWVTEAWTTGGYGEAHPRRYLSLPLGKIFPAAGGSWSQGSALYVVKMIHFFALA